jgi:hypothetical protein
MNQIFYYDCLESLLLDKRDSSKYYNARTRWIDGLMEVGFMLLHATVFGAKRKNVIGGTSHAPNLKVSSMFHSQSVGSSILSRVMEAKNGRMQESDTVSFSPKKYHGAMYVWMEASCSLLRHLFCCVLLYH